MKLVNIKKVCCIYILHCFHIQSIDGLTTKNCVHYEFERKLQNTLKCLSDHLNELASGEYEDQFCHSEYPQVVCLHEGDNVGSCFDEQNTRAIETLTQDPQIRLKYRKILK